MINNELSDVKIQYHTIWRGNIMSIFNFNDSNYVFLLGNGINLLNDLDNSWMKILNKIEPEKIIEHVYGYPLTEFFDLLVVNGKRGYSAYKEAFINEVATIPGSEVHKKLFEFCTENNIIILTTNFDHAFEKGNNLVKGQERSFKNRFSNYYPWQRYYHHAQNNAEYKGTKIYHINGDMMYKNSIKLSILDYANNISYFNKNFNPNKSSNFKKYTQEEEITWINYLFEKEIVIAGLDLGEAEIFIRYLLIERRRYQIKRNQKLNHTGYYLYCRKDFEVEEKGKIVFDENKFNRYHLFFNSVGIKIKEYKDYQDIYSLE